METALCISKTKIGTFKLFLNSFIFSICFNVKIFALIIGKENVIPFVLLFCFLSTIAINGFSIILKYPKKIFLSIYLYVVLTILWLIGGNEIADIYYFSAIIFAFPAIIITNADFVYRWVVLFSLLLGILFCIQVDGYGFLWGDSGEKMYYSYMILPFIILSIIGIILYRKNIFIVCLSICNILIYIPIFLLVGVRGVYMSIMVFVFILLYKTKVFIRFKKQMLLLIVLLSIFVFNIDFEKFIYWLSDFFSAMNIEVYAIDKYLLMLGHSDISNGRSLLYEHAIVGFFDSPLIGNGLGVFEKYNSGLYVHNLFLEVLYEGGILLSSVIFYVLWRYIQYVKGEIDYERYMFFAYLFVAGVSILFYSNTLWRVVAFWLFVGLMFNLYNLKNGKIS